MTTYCIKFILIFKTHYSGKIMNTEKQKKIIDFYKKQHKVEIHPIFKDSWFFENFEQRVKEGYRKENEFEEYFRDLMNDKTIVISDSPTITKEHTYYAEDSNIVKIVCKDLNLTYKQLAEAIGYSESAVNNASRAEISKAMQKVIELYIENLELKKDIENSNKIKSTLKEWLK